MTMSDENDQLDRIEKKVNRALGEQTIEPPYDERSCIGKLHYWANYDEKPGEFHAITQSVIDYQTWGAALALFCYQTGLINRPAAFSVVGYILAITSAMYLASRMVNQLAAGALWIADLANDIGYIR